MKRKVTNVVGWLALSAASCAENTPVARGDATSPIQSISSGERDPRVLEIEASLRDFTERNDTSARLSTPEERMAANSVPGMAVVVIDDGKIILSKGYGYLSASGAEPVDAETVFSVGSVSKLINAALILRLVDAGKLDLDADVNQYLSRWQVPESPFAVRQKVTLRQLLSHTSGFSQHGFPDFQPGEALPSIVQTLNGQSPARHDPVELLFEPGSQMKYSGGGITVSQLVVEEVTGVSYDEAARLHVFEPLGMIRSSFQNPLPPEHGNIAKAHDREGRPQALPRGYEAMPEQAASGLWTSAKDMGLFLTAMLERSDFLSPGTWDQMLSRAPNSWHGLGPRLNGAGEMAVFHHGGSNNSYQAWFEGQPGSKDGLVVLTNGSGGRMLAYEFRDAVERALDWRLSLPDDYDEPEAP